MFAIAVLPKFFIGLFFIGLIASILSTVDSFTMLGAMNLSHDLYKKIFKPDLAEEKEVKLTRYAIIFTAFISFLIAIFSRSIIGIWYTIGTIGISAMLIPLLFGFFYNPEKTDVLGASKKLSASASFYSMILGPLTAIIWLTHGYLNLAYGWPSYWWGVEPMYPGLLISLLTYLIINFLPNKKLPN
jgi:SSS family solute:Na+ symporter